MGNTYLLYTEAKIKGVWRCIDGYIPMKHYGDDEEKQTLMTLYESGSRSLFDDTYTEIKSIGNMVLYSDLSGEVQDEHPGLMYFDPYIDLFNKEDKTEARFPVVSRERFFNHIPDGYEFHGVYHKDMIAAFESGEIDYLYRDTDVDIKSLSKEEAKCYKYYEWDSPSGWWHYFKKIKDALCSTIEKYVRNTYNEIEDVRIVAFKL